jgi:poly-beta-1,6-N-acetyl-D-glucosamine synthase
MSLVVSRMEVLPYIYLGYMFISLYMLAMYLLIFLRNKKAFFDYPEAEKSYSVSFIVPAYNEEATIEDNLKHIFNIDYPIKEVLAINDSSKDNTLKILNSLKKKYPKLTIINNIKNLGKAGSINRGIKLSKGEIIAVVDADSYPASDSLKKMLGFFNDPKVGAVTCPVLPRNRNKLIEKLQLIEYQTISFSRKLLDYVDAIYVTPGPLALYRREALNDIRGFDEKNITEDIEATWHITYCGWERRMCLSTYVTSTVPSKWKQWFKQRRRWNLGGLQCMYKYRKSLFDPKRKIFGFFIIPLFLVGNFLGLLGLAIFFYLLISRVISNLLYTQYSLVAGTPLLTLNDFYITPSFLNYLGIVLFILGAIFTLIMLYILKEKVFKKENVLNIPFYMIIYTTFQPLIIFAAIWHAIRGKMVWR